MGIHKVIYDTDPGVDDAMALLFQVRHPDIELLGITSVFGNATIEDTTRNAGYLAGRFAPHVPVARGAAAPLGACRARSAAVHPTATTAWATSNWNRSGYRREVRSATRASLHHRHRAREPGRSDAARGRAADQSRARARGRSGHRGPRQAGRHHGGRVRHPMACSATSRPRPKRTSSTIPTRPTRCSARPGRLPPSASTSRSGPS